VEGFRSRMTVNERDFGLSVLDRGV
jgi:hypothetical protein